MVDEARAQRHVTAAFAEDRGTASGRTTQFDKKCLAGCQAAGMEFGIAARQVYGIGIPGRIIAGQRRERVKLGPRLVPGVEE